MPTPSKRQLQNEVKTFVIDTALARLEKMKKSKFWPEGGFRNSYGYSHKIYGYRDIITVNARFLDENILDNGRLMINTCQNDWNLIEKQFNRIIKLLDGYETDDIKFEFEHDAAGGSSFWFKWRIG